jgi:predicted dehydrogenase
MRILFVGGAGHHYLRAAVKNPDDARFVADPRDPEATQAKASAAGIAMLPGPVEAAVERFEPDVVNIGTRYGHIGTHAATALRMGIPVVADKPVAATREQLDELESLRDAPPLVTEFDWRARPELIAARQAVQDGRLGPITLAIAQKTYKFGNRPGWYRDRDDFGGLMLWVASHGLDAVRFVCGEASVVSARHGNAGRPEIAAGEDHAVATLALDVGGTAVVHADLARPAGHPSHGEDRLIVRGRDGELVVSDGRCMLTTESGSVEVALPELPPLHEQLLTAAKGESTFPFGTSQTLCSARLLLDAREAADENRISG